MKPRCPDDGVLERVQSASPVISAWQRRRSWRSWVDFCRSGILSQRIRAVNHLNVEDRGIAVVLLRKHLTRGMFGGRRCLPLLLFLCFSDRRVIWKRDGRRTISMPKDGKIVGTWHDNTCRRHGLENAVHLRWCWWTWRCTLIMMRGWRRWWRSHDNTGSWAVVISVYFIRASVTLLFRRWLWERVDDFATNSTTVPTTSVCQFAWNSIIATAAVMVVVSKRSIKWWHDWIAYNRSCYWPSIRRTVYEQFWCRAVKKNREEKIDIYSKKADLLF